MKTWDILICSIPHRQEKLHLLLKELDRQISETSEVGVRICYDNLQSSYGSKCNALLCSSEAEYVSFIDDDDMVAPDFIQLVLVALDTQPHYVGFPVKFTSNGAPMIRVEHSLRHGGWHDTGEMLKRDIAQFNPIRRDIAMLGLWQGGNGAERDWSNAVRASGQCSEEVWIDKEMYYYQHCADDTFLSGRSPYPEVPALPQYPWLTEVDVA
jgi:hypothetical protein